MLFARGDHPPRPVPGGGLRLEAPVADSRGVAGSAAGPGEQVLDGPLQHIVGREADSVRHTPPLQRLVQGRKGQGRVGSDDDGLPPGPGAVNDGPEAEDLPGLRQVPEDRVVARVLPVVRINSSDRFHASIFV
jgi:hypothetical protein